MELEWKPIQEFPNYLISNYGDIVNAHSGRWMAQSKTLQGVPKVGLIKGTRQYTRSVSVLVAETFVRGRDTLCDTPIRLDGDRTNNRADNLVWRPRWFAWEYTHQFSSIDQNAHIGPIRDPETGRRYLDVYEAAIINGLLFKDIRRSIVVGDPCFPTYQRFETI